MIVLDEVGAHPRLVAEQWPLRFGLKLPDQRARAVLRELRASGFTCAAVAAELDRHGFRSRTGRPWVRQSVHVLGRMHVSSITSKLKITMSYCEDSGPRIP